MRRFRLVHGAFLAVVLASGAAPRPPLAAQLSTGTVIATILDPATAPFPGAEVTLRRVAGRDSDPARRSGRANRRGQVVFLSVDPGLYSLRIEAAGFLPEENASLSVLAGQPTLVQVQLSPVPGETVTVTAEPPSPTGSLAVLPVLTLRRDEIESAPLGDDPWSVASRAPGVLSLGLDSGGSAAGQQFLVAGGGAAASETLYAVDGVLVTDVISSGASTYFDFDQFDEVDVATGAFDLASSNAGVTIQMSTRRASDAWRGSARYHLADGAWQARGTDRQEELGARVEAISEYGLEAGGRWIPRRVWLWVGGSQSDIERTQRGGIPVDIGLANVGGKLHLAFSDLPRSSASILVQRSEKSWNGRGLGPTRSDEAAWNQSGPFELLKGQVDLALADTWRLHAAASRTDSRFLLAARGKGDIVMDAAGVWRGGFATLDRVTSAEQGQLELSGVLEDGRHLHSLRIGFQGRRHEDGETETWGERSTVAYEAGSMDQHALIEALQIAPRRMRESYAAAWLGDALHVGRASWQFGVRYDLQDGRTFDTEAAAHQLFPELLPAFRFAGRDYGFEWRSLSPRLAGSFALGDRGGSVFRLGLASFPSQLSATAGAWQLRDAYRSAYTTFDDLDGDHRLDLGEPVFDQTLETLAHPPGAIDPDLDPERYDTAALGIDRNLGERGLLRASIDLTWRRNTQVLEERRLVEDGSAIRVATRSDYVLRETVSGVLPDGSPYAVPVHGLAPGLENAGTYLINGDREREYRALTLSLARPWVDGWSLRTHVTWSDWRWHLGEGFRRHDDPTDASFGGKLDFGVDPADGEGEIAGVFWSGADGAGYLASARWSYGLVARRTLFPERPWSFDVAASWSGRDGFPLAYARRVFAGDGGGGVVQITQRPGDFATDPIHLLDLRVEKALRLGQFDATLGIDGFNLLASDATLERVRYAGPNLGRALEVAAPRSLRVGLRLRVN